MTADNNIEEKLREFSIFEELSDEDLQTVLNKVSLVRFERGETIIAHEAHDTDVFLLLEGQALANRYSLAGREISYRRLPAYSYVGELAVFDGQPRSVNIVALSEVVMGRLSGAAFRELMVELPSVTQALLRDLSSRIRDLSDRIYETTASSVKMRFYTELIRTAMAQDGEEDEIILRNPPTHAEWAATVGGQRETITRAISELTTLGLLRKKGRSLVIPDINGLMDQCEDI
ncbi:Crp/Fnr family transcriptional regulator [uncultured Erythrobacter sp.]|uniref:Crp/Fnr family transcriptional regulator n=1 Tax=uncultured Erythrobacter sp. TaxID=263913 RepID=UPI00260B919A|nr:Crp/Fnr family transcriptional regulator [uncultured Erythrobacter sp.]